jgi:hypothetical protein
MFSTCENQFIEQLELCYGAVKVFHLYSLDIQKRVVVTGC